MTNPLTQDRAHAVIHSALRGFATEAELESQADYGKLSTLDSTTEFLMTRG